jgi:predicted aspartyl protease
MIQGSVNARCEIVIPFPIQAATGQIYDIEAVLDTGFSGSLTLPPPVVAVLGLPWHSRTLSLLANGQLHLFDNHEATVLWDGIARPILVQAVESVPMIGLALMVGFDLRVRFKSGGSVELEAVP